MQNEKDQLNIRLKSYLGRSGELEEIEEEETDEETEEEEEEEDEDEDEDEEGVEEGEGDDEDDLSIEEAGDQSAAKNKYSKDDPLDWNQRESDGEVETYDSSDSDMDIL